MNIWLYWDNVNGRETPGYIKLCIKSLMKFCGDKHAVYILNKNNLEHYLTDLPSDLYRVERDTYDNSFKGYVKRINRNKRRASRIAIRLAYLRMRLLYEYGGLWLDSDCITMSDYEYVESALRDFEIVGVSKKSHGDHHIANNFIAANKGSEKIGEILESQERLIRKRYLRWGEIGGHLLEEKLRGYKRLFLIDENRVLPLPWQEAFRFFEDEPVDLVENSNPLCCMLYNNIFPDSFKKKSAESLCNENTLISRLLRKYA